MKTTITIYGVIIMTGIMFFSQQSDAQEMEVVGKAKITVMDLDNTAENLVVQLPDGTLGVREASSLPGSTGNYGTVVNPGTGKVWLDRNLGASQVATSSTDAASYGDLYQWGRGPDGHQVPTSGTSSSQSSHFFSINGQFIISHANWLSNVETHMWSGTAAENNPCPSGFRIPTVAEWNQERLTWISSNAAGAFSSALKLPMAGGRDGSDGSLGDAGSEGNYWSSTVSSTFSFAFDFGSSFWVIGFSNRADGMCVRCIKD